MKRIKELWIVSKQGGSFIWVPHRIIRQSESMVFVEGFEPNTEAGIPLIALATTGQAKHRSGVFFLTEGLEVSV
jgi:hypothetical protein